MSDNPNLYAPVDDVAKPMTLLLKGDSGAGKTYKAAHWPKPALFNFDNNLSSIRKLPAEIRKNIRIVDPRADKNNKQLKDVEIWKNFVDKIEVVAADPEINTIIIDSVTTMAEVLKDKILKSEDPSKSMEIQHWGEYDRYMKWLGEHLLCANDLDKHVIFLAHERIFEEKLTGKVKYFMSVGGQTKNNFDLYFTDVWRVYTKPVKDGSVEYWIRTLPNEYHTAKSSLVVPPDFKWEDQYPNIMKQLQEGLTTA